MNKASSAFLATAGVTVGLLGFALPAGAATASGGGSAPHSGLCKFSSPNSGPEGFTKAATVSADQGGQGSGFSQVGQGGQGSGPSRADQRGQGDKGSNSSYQGDQHGKKGKTHPCSHPQKPCSHPTPPCEKKPWTAGEYLKGHTSKNHTRLVCKVPPCHHKANPCPPKCKKKGSHHHTPGEKRTVN